jgi:hypothetical protein
MAESSPRDPLRLDARIRVDLTFREARALARAAALVADVLLVTAHQVLVASCERAGVDLGSLAR